MTITLTVRTALWRAHVAKVAGAVEGLVPVIKGNGYGFGRLALAQIAAEFGEYTAVGTVHELDGLPDGLQPGVLTPTRARPLCLRVRASGAAVTLTSPPITASASPMATRTA